MTNIFCYQSGEIVFTDKSELKGALPIILGASEGQVEQVKVFARLAYDNVTHLVPGVPEGETHVKRYAAFKKFRDLMASLKPKEKSQ